MARKYPYARVRLYLNECDAPIALDVPLPCTMEWDGIQPLKLPSPDDDAFDRMMCSSVATRRLVMGTRQQIASAITKAVLELLGKRDTTRGYTRDELAEFPTSEQ